MIRLTILAMFALGLAGGANAADPQATPAAAPSTLGPQELVENSAKRMLVELDANRPMYAKDPAKLDALVANVLLPNFDTEYAARLVLGQTWRTATPDQRKRFGQAVNGLKQRVSEALEGRKAALDSAGGNRNDAATMLGVDRTTLYRLMKRLGL